MLLEIEAIDAFYGRAHVLHGVSLRIGAGEAVALIGRNGAGKSTLLKAIMDSGPRVHGAIRVDGRTLAGTATHRRARMGLALVPEDRRMFAHLTVLQTLQMAKNAVPSGAPAPDAAAILARFPMLDGLARRGGAALSGGQQQMVAVARGMAAAPRLLMLDEPTEGLAPLVVADLAERVRAARGDGGPALLLAEQNLRFARALTDRVALIDSGRVVFDGTWAALDGAPALVRRHVAL